MPAGEVNVGHNEPWQVEQSLKADPSVSVLWQLVSTRNACFCDSHCRDAPNLEGL